MIGHIVFKI